MNMTEKKTIKNTVFCGLGGINHGIVVPQRLQITPRTWLYKLKRSHKRIVKSSIEKITVKMNLFMFNRIPQ